MTKTLNTLVQDIYDVLEGKGGWDAVITEFMSSGVQDLLKHRLEDGGEERVAALRMSNLGRPCLRQTWYDIHRTNEGEALGGSTLLKFLYGDLIEVLVISLARAAGHQVEGCQDTLEIRGVKGHRDCVIDGITVDVKSASPFSFEKFKHGDLRNNDPFGYIRQLASYVYAGRDGETATHPTVGAFLVIDKVSGEICLDLHDFSQDIEGIEDKVDEIKATINSEDVPPRAFEPVNDGYYNTKKKEFVPNGNKKLGLNCGYCGHKHTCYPGLRTFLYKSGNSMKPTFFTSIVKEPKVTEVTDA